MKSYGQFCPVAQAAEIVSERWTPLVLRELLCGSRRFNDIKRGVPTMSPSLLSRRLKTLQEHGVIEKVEAEGGTQYELTSSGEELRPVIEALGVWGERWVRTLPPEKLDPALLMWDVRRRVDVERLPTQRIVVSFELRGAPRGQRDWWLVLDRPDVDVCLFDPGHGVDLSVVTDVRTMTEIWLGDETFARAQRAGVLELEGPRRLRAALPRWLLRSSFAEVRPVGRR